ncbi:H-type small acid-soluble spore protein [Paenibacillus crassostreae]|uniref:Spore protein H n=1 Tax=Paenibacillus crassostreae TaxID=1763538 RepID=A0A167GL49_9BACL|nr:H-type small acid-soluble spore protein [Paenibacillus crassostreae]AOZ92214.1 small, acid-soluble spore protein, H family [Paenibacillus crassostreae]OAB77676.1 spore protein H [Paenibacillus crassostreae]
MNKQRAIEISESAVMENVTYQGTPVFIQHVNDDDTARIYPLHKSEQEMIVPLGSLMENKFN